VKHINITYKIELLACNTFESPRTPNKARHRTGGECISS
jgi:hypothetical protein